MFILCLISSVFAQNSNIETVRQSSHASVAGDTMAIVLSCQPGGEVGKKVTADYEGAAKKLADALTVRSDVQTLIVMHNPNALEVIDWLQGQKNSLNGDRYRLTIVGVSCLGFEGDQDNEQFPPDLLFADIVGGIAPLTNSSMWLLDASRDESTAAGVATYGPTADDLIKFNLLDVFGVSSGPPGVYAGSGLLEAAASVIEAKKSSPISFGDFYQNGIKIQANDLDLYSTKGIQQNDAWGSNPSRLVFLGGPLLQTEPSLPEATVPKKPPLLTGPRILLGVGTVSLLGSGFFGLQAISNYQTLVDFNENGNGSQGELDLASQGYQNNFLVSGILGGVGGVGMIGGVVWSVIDHKKNEISVMTDGNTLILTGSF